MATRSKVAHRAKLGALVAALTTTMVASANVSLTAGKAIAGFRFRRSRHTVSPPSSSCYWIARAMKTSSELFVTGSVTFKP